MKQHTLKTWRQYIERCIDGTKTFEVRRNDRGFSVGDELLLREYNPLTNEYGSLSANFTVTFVLDGGQFGIETGFCVMGIQRIAEANK